MPNVMMTWQLIHPICAFNLIRLPRFNEWHLVRLASLVDLGNQSFALEK